MTTPICGIYGITYRRRIVYVGSSMHVRRRYSQHQGTLKRRVHRNFVLQRIFDKNPDGLNVVVLETAEDAMPLATLEQAWIDKVKPVANLSSARGSHPHTEAAKAKMRAHVRTPEHRAKISAAMKGRTPPNKGRRGVYKHTLEARAKISEAGRGQVYSDERRAAMSARQRGRVFTPEHREKLRQAKLGKPNDAVRRALTGRRQSPELAAKRVASFKSTIITRKAAT